MLAWRQNHWKGKEEHYVYMSISVVSTQGTEGQDLLQNNLKPTIITLNFIKATSQLVL